MIVIEVEVSWSTVYYTLDLSAIWIWHLQNTKMSKSTWNHLSHADRWSWLRPKYLGQWYTIVQTFWPFGYDIFKIPKRQNHLDLSHGDCDWGRSILVNGILCFRLSGHLDMTSSKYQNVIINSVSGSNLRGSLGIMYHMVIDDSKRSARVWSIIEVPRRFWPPRVHETAISPLFPAQTCADHLESCITWWYMIPSAGHKFEGLSKVSQGF